MSVNTDTAWPDTPSATAAAASSGHDHSGQSSSSSSSSSTDMSQMMHSTFFTSTTTPLYSTAWTPGSTGSYAGSCFFLIVLAIVFRALFAFKHVLERRWLDQRLNRRYVVVAGRPTEAQRISEDADAEAESKATLLVSPNGVEEHVRVVRRHARPVLPWSLRVDLPRAALLTVLIGIGYLLMLAVMTYNVGYFLSILAGVFIGEVAFGRYGNVDIH
ncbi:MAG: hypothetical protein M1825_002587 [Sarcosagium campestre]|nr:MAG: hypothetical protein M1825_002587 [Sarcosagium campestre]